MWGALCLAAVAAVFGWHPGAPPARAEVRPPSPLPPLITPQAQRAIERGLDWLAQRQTREGFWSDDGTYGRFPIAMSSLAGLALSASGSTPTQGPYSPQVSRVLTFLLNSAQEDGLITRGGSEDSHSMYGHGFSMLFLAELYGMEEDRERQQRIHRVLQEAVKLTDRAQSNAGGWYYKPTSNFDEGSVTVTQVQALRACRNAGIAVPKKVIDDAVQYLTDCSLPDGGIAYRVGMTQSRPPITAAAVVCWYDAGLSQAPECRKALRFVTRLLGGGQNAEAELGHMFYTHLYMAQAMYLSGDDNWNRYFPKIRERLLAAQQEDGSWNDRAVGTVYGTSLALIILQIPYQNLSILQR